MLVRINIHWGLTGIAILGFPDSPSIHQPPHSDAGVDQNGPFRARASECGWLFRVFEQKRRPESGCFQQVSRAFWTLGHLGVAFDSQFPADDTGAIDRGTLARFPAT